MSRLKKLQDREAAIVAEMRGIVAQAEGESRDLTDDEHKSYAAMETELEKEIGPAKAREVRLQERERSLGRVRDVNEDTDAERDARAGETKPKGPVGFASLGEQLQAIRRASDPAIGYVDPRLGRPSAAATGMNETSKTDGGWLVEKDFSSELLRRVYERSMLAGRVRKIPLGPNSNGLKMNKIKEDSRVAGSRFGGVRTYWTPEAGLKQASTLQLEPIELGLGKLTGLLYATDELLEDATALEAVISDAFEDAFAYDVDDAILNGTGVGMPLGILRSGALITAAAEGGQGATTLEYANVVSMWARAWSRSKSGGNLVWLINADVEPRLQTMYFPIGTGGVPVYLPPGGLTQAPYGQLFGKPVIPVEQLATSGTVGDILLVDLNEYILIDKGPMKKATSIHVRFIYDETAFRFVYRVGGQPTWDTPLTPANGSNTYSPYVALATRS